VTSSVVKKRGKSVGSGESKGKPQWGKGEEIAKVASIAGFIKDTLLWCWKSASSTRKARSKTGTSIRSHPKLSGINGDRIGNGQENKHHSQNVGGNLKAKIELARKKRANENRSQWA